MGVPLRHFFDRFPTWREQQFPFGWRQAGFGSFAYRLAHLAIPRGPVVAGLCLVFYLN